MRHWKDLLSYNFSRVWFGFQFIPIRCIVIFSCLKQVNASIDSHKCIYWQFVQSLEDCIADLSAEEWNILYAHNDEFCTISFNVKHA